eukprot:10920110-Karenia_brevis.AAC.1
MESLFLKQLCKCEDMEEQLAHYERQIIQQGKQGDYDVLVHIVRTRLESRRCLRNREKHGA